MRLEELSWQEYSEVISSGIVVLPIGAIDAHGPHLPLSTDTLVSAHIAERLEATLDSALLLPTIPYGVRTDPVAGGGEFPGATSVRSGTLLRVIVDILRASHSHGARRFLIIDSHRANVPVVREAARYFVEQAPDARVVATAWWDLVSEETRNAIAAETGVSRSEDHHAALVESSLVMHVAPRLVRDDRLVDDHSTRAARYLVLPVPPELRTRTGVVYRAKRASSAIGERVLDEVVANLLEMVALELPDRS